MMKESTINFAITYDHRRDNLFYLFRTRIIDSVRRRATLASLGVVIGYVSADRLSIFFTPFGEPKVTLLTSLIIYHG